VGSEMCIRDSSNDAKRKVSLHAFGSKALLDCGPHRARKIGHDRLRVIVPIKKHKNERWTFKIISEEEIGN